MRRYCTLLITVLLALAGYSIAFAQGDNLLFLPTLRHGTAVPNMSILNNWSVYESSISNDVFIVGEVHNTGTANAAFVHINAFLVDGLANELARGAGVVLDRVIVPGEVSCFYVLVDNPPTTGIPSVAFKKVLTQHIPPVADLTIFDVSESYSSGSSGALILNGKVRNNDTITATDVTVVGTFYSDFNREGLVLNCVSGVTNPGDLLPGQSGTFSISIGRAAPVASYHLEAQTGKPDTLGQ